MGIFGSVMSRIRLFRLIAVGNRQMRRHFADDKKFFATEEEKFQHKRKTTTPSQVYSGAMVEGSQFYFTDDVSRTTAHDTNDQMTNNYLSVKSYTSCTFRLNNGMSLFGPIAIFPKTTLSWMVPSVDHINEESLEFFTLIEPKFDVLIIGVGDYKNVEPVRNRLRDFFKKHRLNVEILATEHACATFNYLNSECRNVAAALFPPDDVQPSPGETIKFNVDDPEWSKLPSPRGTDLFGIPYTRDNSDTWQRLKKFSKERLQRLQEDDKTLSSQLGRKKDDDNK